MAGFGIPEGGTSGSGMAGFGMWPSGSGLRDATNAPKPESRTPNPEYYGTSSDLGSIRTIQSPLYMSFTYASPSFTTTPHVIAVFFT